VFLVFFLFSAFVVSWVLFLADWKEDSAVFLTLAVNPDPLQIYLKKLVKKLDKEYYWPAARLATGYQHFAEIFLGWG
jgi:membrane protein implicated in regulation of membrane protease activity